ncbi:MAG: outer membrane protein transport protein [Myxococcales bacterium]|nr:outer membrane protein transport protein [Myxococcales bacterium]
MTVWRLAALVVLLTTPAAANPFFIGRFDGLRGDPVDTGAFALYWNPAALARPGLSAQVHVLGVDRQASYDRVAAWNGVSEEDAAVNAGRNETGALGVVPALAGRYGLTLGPIDLGFGAGAYITRAGATNWKRPLDAPAEHPGALDGPQRWATINTSLVMLSGSAGLAVRYRPLGVSLGVAPVYNAVTLDTLRARNPDKTERLVDERGDLAEGRILLEDGEGTGLTWILGLRVEPMDGLALGLTWHTEADYRLEGNAFITFGTADEGVERSVFNLPVAQTVRLGAAIALTEALTLRPSVVWNQWSVMTEQIARNKRNGETLLELARDFDDTWMGRLRADYALVPGLALHAGLGYETAATPEHTFEPGLAESESVEMGVGATVELTAELSLSASFIWQQFADVTVRDSVQQPTTNGRYTDARQYATLDLEVHL